MFLITLLVVVNVPSLFLCSRVQRRDRRVQEHLLHRVGRRRPGQDPAAVAPLLPEHAGPHLRRRLQRQGENLRGPGRVAKDGGHFFRSVHMFRIF